MVRVNLHLWDDLSLVAVRRIDQGRCRWRCGAELHLEILMCHAEFRTAVTFEFVRSACLYQPIPYWPPAPLLFVRPFQSGERCEWRFSLYSGKDDQRNRGRE